NSLPRIWSAAENSHSVADRIEKRAALAFFLARIPAAAKFPELAIFFGGNSEGIARGFGGGFDSFLLLFVT
ncbi:hypothetical protein, partial [Streptomyces sp. C10-9-1]|uniref:hypothetical protein n=1 Tax=Streptomyces sp. C10-9-1 TaxID=1859285 RepID=UPI003F4A6E1F